MDCHRRAFVGLAASLAMGWTRTARSQDFGKMLEDAARGTLSRTLDPQRLAAGASQRSDQRLLPVKTPDGWTLVLHRYPPSVAPRPGALPVILCHGLTYSAAFWDLDPSVSMARYLASQGFDVWCVDLRGSGMATKWVFRLEQTGDALIGGALRKATNNQLMPTGYTTLDPKFANWNLDDHVLQDLPTCIRVVKKVTGSPQVAWVGHSMGGIVALAHLARQANPGIGKLVTVGSQLTMHDAQLVLPFLNEMLRTRQRQLTGQIQADELAQATRTSVQNLFFNTSHVDPKVYQLLSLDRTDIPAIGLMQQYMTMSSKGELWDATGKFNYTASARNVQVPLLIACGAVDRFAPPSVQQDIYNRVGSTDKTLLVFGRAQGYAADSGHDDALVGRTSPQQAWPQIANWLAGSSG